MKRALRIGVIFLVGFPVLAIAQFQWSGYLKFFAHVNRNAPHSWDRLGTRCQLRLNKYFGEQAAFFAAFNLNYEENQVDNPEAPSRSQGMEVFPVEAYLDLYFPLMDIRIGKQFIFWGKADWINPTDNINPWDYINIAAEVEDYRIPVTALRAQLYLGNWTIESVWIPRFHPHKIPIRQPESMGPFPVKAIPTRFPENRLSNSEWALRLRSRFLQIDFSLSYFQGFRKFPDILIQFIPTGDPTPYFTWQHYYQKVHIWGGDFIRTIGKWAIKGEGAYFLTEDREGTNIFLENPYWQAVVGLDWNVTNDLTMTWQFSRYARLKYDQSEERKRWLQLGLPNASVAEPFEDNLSTRIQYQLSDFTTVQLIGVVNLKQKDSFLLPILNYELSDGINIYAGATLFNGPQDSPFGRNKSYSRYFVEVKYSF